MARAVIRALLGVAMLALLAGAAGARADGLPVLGIGGGGAPIRSADGRFTYETRPAGRTTIVKAIGGADGSVLSVRIPGRYAIPVVAYDGTPAGLSTNGRTLALIRSRTRFPQSPTRLAILDAGTLRTKRAVLLARDFSFDAISPDGRWIYLIQYTSPKDPTRYRVRALDAPSGRLLPGAIVDRTEPDEPMRGNPITRVTSADGRWAYTLYDGDGEPFVHALDTATRRARCLDLPAFPRSSVYQNTRLGFAAGGHQLLVTLSGRTLATIDTTSLRVGRPAPRSVRAERAARAESPARGQIGLGFPVALGVVLLGAALLAVRRRRARAAANRSSRESALPH